MSIKHLLVFVFATMLSLSAFAEHPSPRETKDAVRQAAQTVSQSAASIASALESQPGMGPASNSFYDLEGAANQTESYIYRGSTKDQAIDFARSVRRSLRAALYTSAYNEADVYGGQGTRIQNYPALLESKAVLIRQIRELKQAAQNVKTRRPPPPPPRRWWSLSVPLRFRLPLVTWQVVANNVNLLKDRFLFQSTRGQLMSDSRLLFT